MLWKRVAVVMENQCLFTSMGVGLANSARDDPNLELAAFEKIFPKADALELGSSKVICNHCVDYGSVGLLLTD